MTTDADTFGYQVVRLARDLEVPADIYAATLARLLHEHLVWKLGEQE